MNVLSENDPEANNTSHSPHDICNHIEPVTVAVGGQVLLIQFNQSSINRSGYYGNAARIVT